MAVFRRKHARSRPLDEEEDDQQYDDEEKALLFAVRACRTACADCGREMFELIVTPMGATMRGRTARPGSAEKTVRDIRRATRRQYSAEEKIGIVLEGLRGETSIAELCRKEGIAQSLYCGGRRSSSKRASPCRIHVARSRRNPL